MDDIDKIEQSIDRLYSEAELNQLNKKFKKRFQIEVEQDYYNIFIVLVVLLQSLSAVLALGGVMELYRSFTNEGFLLVLLAFCSVIILEVAKHKIYTSFFYAKKSGTRIPKISYLVIIGLLAFSAPSSYFGSYFTVSNFAKAPTLVDTDSITNHYNTKIESVSAYWLGLESEAKEKAKDIHEKNSWKGRTSRDARDEVLAFTTKAKSMQDSLINKKAYLLTMRDKELLQAKAENKSIITNHKEWCASFGGWLAIIVVLADFFTFGLLYWIVSFKERKRTFLKTIKERKEQSKEEPQETYSSTKVKEHKEEIKTEPYRNSISLTRAEGQIIEYKDKAPRILVKRADGVLVERTAGAVRNWANSSKGKRKEHLTVLLNKLENYKND